MQKVKWGMALALVWVGSAAAQDVTRDSLQTTKPDEAFDRPFITGFDAGRTAIGGYLEGNTNYFVEDGITEGFSMELRRFNIFLYSSIGSRIKFISELEFEHGTEEIALETALIDLEISPAFVLRGGILLPPLGLFNQNHDSPRWDFINRPLVSTTIIPSTLSEVGFGMHGRIFAGALGVSYEGYIVNGLDDGVILNAEGRTFLPSGKGEEAFEEDNNGVPAFTGRLSVEHSGLGELGLSYYGGVYNSFRMEGEQVDERRGVSVIALDFQTDLLRSAIQGELAFSRIEVPAHLSEVFGERQFGLFIESVNPLLRFRVLRFDQAVLNANVRFEYVDYNVGTFTSTGLRIHDEVTALVLGMSFRPTSETVFKGDYRHHWSRDLLGNPTVRLGGFQFGFATYF